MEQNNNTHRILAGTVLYHSFDSDVLAAIDSPFRFILIKKV